MADNVPLNPGAGPLDSRSVEKSGTIQTQVIIQDVGGGGAESLQDGTKTMGVLGAGSATVGNVGRTVTRGTSQVMIAMQSVPINTGTNNGCLYSSAYTPTNLVALNWDVNFLRETTTVFTNAPQIFVEGTMVASPGPQDWKQIGYYQPGVGTNLTSEPTTGATSDATVPMTTTGTLAVGQVMSIIDGTVANSELFYPQVVTTNTSITAQESFANAHLTSLTVYNGAEQYSSPLDPTYASYRVKVDGSQNAATAFVIQVRFNPVVG